MFTPWRLVCCRLRVSTDPRFEARYAEVEDRDEPRGSSSRSKLEPNDLRHELSSNRKSDSRSAPAFLNSSLPPPPPPPLNFFFCLTYFNTHYQQMKLCDEMCSFGCLTSQLTFSRLEYFCQTLSTCHGCKH